MNKILLLHPEGKKGIAMDLQKYNLLQATLLDCLKTAQPATWVELLPAVEQSLKIKKHTVQGKLEWNLFWVTLDLVAKHKIKKNKSVTPILYTLCQTDDTLAQ